MIESVVAVFIHKHEVFYFIRQLTLKAFPGYHAFPGGKIDSDESDTPFETRFLGDYPPRQMRALCRELTEELGFDLEGSAAAGDIIDFSYLGLARPPIPAIGKFSAHHFKIVLGKKFDFCVESGEACDYGWIDIDKLWSLYNDGKVLAVIPTIRVIEALARDINREKIEKLNLVCDHDKEVPVLELIRGVHFLFVESQTFKISQRTNALVVGDPAYLVDPSPNKTEELKRVLHSLGPFKLEGIVITHHHPDHHENACSIARELNLHIKCSIETRRLLLKRFGENYLDGVEVITVKDGDILTRWLGRDVRIYELPGHDSGQIGIAPDSMEWFFVGDLIQASNWAVVGVVIPDGNGDMGKYFLSLQRVIELDPRVIIPSHGMPLGSSYHLKEALKSRREREDQILKLRLDGKSEDEILFSAYGVIDESLHFLARMNIRAHLKKLAMEKKIPPV